MEYVALDLLAESLEVANANKTGSRNPKGSAAEFDGFAVRMERAPAALVTSHGL